MLRGSMSVPTIHIGPEGRNTSDSQAKKNIHETYTDRTSNLCLGKLQMKHSFPSFLKNYECIVEAERYWRIYHSIRFEFSRSSANVSMIIPKILTML